MSNWGNSETLSNQQNFTQNERDQGKLTAFLFPSFQQLKDNTKGLPVTHSYRLLYLL